MYETAPLWGVSEVSAEPTEVGGYANEAVENDVVLQCRVMGSGDERRNDIQ